MKDKILILHGAGLTAGPDFFKISTLGLTEEFIAYSNDDLSDDKEIVKFIYEEFCFWNKLDPKDVSGNLSQINFETIIQIVEELFVFIEDVERSKHKTKYQRSVKNTVFELNSRLITHINRVRIPKWKDFIYLFIEKIHNHLIDLVIDKLLSYNIDSSNKGMVEYVNFLNQGFGQTSKRIYTLNYDTWLNQFSNYFDGFSPTKLDRDKILFDRDVDCHYNLHGCILWQLFDTKEKLATPNQWKHHQSFAGYTIAREAILPTPIITGYNKLTRINQSPYLEFFHSFTQDCSISEKILIVGYSFSDPHINNIFRLIPAKAKIVIVVYHSVTSLQDYSSDLNIMISEVSEIFNTHFSNLKIRNNLKYTVDCDNQKVSIFLNGIGQDFYDEYLKI